MADRIRKINVETGTVHAVVKTGNELPATASITGMSVALDGTIYAVDNVNDVVYRISEDGTNVIGMLGAFNTPGDVVSSGLEGSDGNDARISAPVGVAVDKSNNIYLSDAGNHKIKRLSPSGRSQTFVGDGASGDSINDNGLLAELNTPRGVDVDLAGIVYVADSLNHKIRKMWPSGKTVTLAGSSTGFANGQGNAAQFATPLDVAVDRQGNVYVADNGNVRLRRIDESGNVVTLAGGTSGFVDDQGNDARFSSLDAIAMEPGNNWLWVLDRGNSAIRRVFVDGRVRTFSPANTTTIGSAASIAVDQVGFLYFLEQNV
jgi:sugar lactone lactonase YvrE